MPGARAITQYSTSGTLCCLESAKGFIDVTTRDYQGHDQHPYPLVKRDIALKQIKGQ